MNRNCLFSKALALLLCAVLLIGYLPSIALPAAAEDWESDIDVVETTEPETTEPPLGSEENPIILYDLENTVENVDIMYYQCYNMSGTTMTVTGEGEFSVAANGETIAAVDGSVSVPVTNTPRTAFNFSITGTGSYQVNFVYPEGSYMNPEVLEVGYNEVSLEENSQGYYYTWTADATGTLHFMIESITEGVEADIVIDNATSYANKTLTADGVENEDGAVVVSMPVTEGDQISIQVTVLPDENYNYPAADIAHSSWVTYPEGSEQNPIYLTEMENTVTNAGTLYYATRFDAVMTITGEGEFSIVYDGETINAVDGTLSIPVAPAGFWSPALFTLTGDGEYSISFEIPVGTSENPAVAVLGDNECTIEEGNDQGYFWTYTAEKAGKLVVTVNAEAGWSYTINNLTTGTYGDMQWSDSDPVVNPAVIEVAEGDEIQIIVNNYDPSSYVAPAGDITVNLIYADDIVLPTGNAALKFSGGGLTLENDLTVNFIIRPDVVADGNYTNVRVDFKIGDSEEIVSVPLSEATLNAQGRYQFGCKGIAPYMMNEVITGTLYGTYMGIEYSVTTTYYAAQYCYTQLKSASVPNDLKKVCVDLLNYGTAHQLYKGTVSAEEDYINYNLTAEQKALGTQETPVAENFMNASAVVIENPTASFRGASLSLNESVDMRFTVQCENLEGVTLKLEWGDGKVLNIDSADFVAQSTANRYYVYFKGLAAKEMRTLVSATVCRDGVAISNTAEYSIESYVYSARTSAASSELLLDLVDKMLRYGDSAEAYFG